MAKKEYRSIPEHNFDWNKDIDVKMKERNRLASMSAFEKFAIWLDNFWKNITEKLR